MIFIDTGALIARFVERDQYHVHAVEFWRGLQTERTRCLTSNFVLSETFTLLARRTTYQFAVNRARSLYASTVLQILRPSDEDEHAALGYFDKYADQQVSFTDCVSFALMERHGIRDVFTFDRHFMMAGFVPRNPLPDGVLGPKRRRIDRPRPANLDAFVAELVEQGIAAAGPRADNLSASIVNRVEKELILHVLADCDNVQTKAADRLGINRNTLRKKLEEYGLEPP